MKFAIIAAGEGSRLAQEGVQLPKPLVTVGGEPMLGRLIRIFLENGATGIVLIVGERDKAVQEYVRQLALPVSLQVVTRNTASSMHSFHAIAPYLKGEPFCLTTVDTIFREADFQAYIRHFTASEEDGCMAVTPFIDDEKPLYVGVDENKLITGFHDTPLPDDHYISGGIYCLRDNALDVLERCVDEGMARMRNFQRRLVEEGFRLEAFPFPKIVDVDHKGDIAKAEAFLQKQEKPVKRIVGVGRGSQFSPNMVNNDSAILQAVAQQLREKGYTVDLYDEDRLVEEQIKGESFFSMARGEKAVRYLQQLEREGATVINSGFGVANCARHRMTRLLTANNIPHPRNRIIPMGGTFPDNASYPCWLKRGDSSAQVKEDICFITNRKEGEEMLSRFWQRGITLAVVNEFLQGDLIKFYGVQDTDFFHWSYPSVTAYTKFGLESINGKARGLPFSVSQLKQYADRSAQILNVPVYGGDCVVQEHGEIKIFDFNDWPSFSPCREAAAEKIAEYIHKRITNHGKE